MKRIIKGAEPSELSAYKRTHPRHVYKDLGDDPLQIRSKIRQACLAEQYYLCAYCCKRIGNEKDDCHNEHVLSQRDYPHKSLDFQNIVSSCESKNSCGDAKGNQKIAITPFDPDCENQFQFNLSGTVTGLSDDAKQTIEVLQLGESLQQNRKLVDSRKQAISNFLLSESIDSNDVSVIDDEYLAMLVEILQQPVDGELQPFAPIIVKALENWIQGNK